MVDELIVAEERWLPEFLRPSVTFARG
jgi:hypothetical protein